MLSSLTDQRIIQAGTYISLIYMKCGKLYPCKLFNIRTGELSVVTVDDPKLFIEILMRGK